MVQMPDLTQLAKRVTDTVAGTKLLSTTTRTAARRAMFMAALATMVLNRRSSNILKHRQTGRPCLDLIERVVVRVRTLLRRTRIQGIVVAVACSRQRDGGRNNKSQ